MADSGSPCTTFRWGRALLVAAFAVIGGLLCASLICLKFELVERCDPLNLTFTGSGSAEECQVLHYGPGQEDKPCCYHDDRDGFAATDVCDPNPVSLADQKACRSGSRKPEVKIEGNKCTFSIKETDSRDAGLYEFRMPYKSKLPQEEKHVDSDICYETVKSFWFWWLILIACCSAVVLLVAILLMIFRKKIFPCCYAAENPEADQNEMRDLV